MIVVTARGRPHEMLLLTWSLVLGALQLAGVTGQANLLAQVLPGWTLAIWGAAMATSGAIGLAAWLVRVRIRLSLRLEQSAMLVGAGPLIAYSAIILTSRGLVTVLGAGVVGAWALANVIRAYNIRADLRTLGDAGPC